jgi:hypothetical protein
MPVIPGRSFELPTCATHPPATVGSSCLSTISSRIPFESCFSITGTFCADAGNVAIPSANATVARHKLQFCLLKTITTIAPLGKTLSQPFWLAK